MFLRWTQNWHDGSPLALLFRGGEWIWIELSWCLYWRKGTSFLEEKPFTDWWLLLGKHLDSIVKEITGNSLSLQLFILDHWDLQTSLADSFCNYSSNLMCEVLLFTTPLVHYTSSYAGDIFFSGVFYNHQILIKSEFWRYG